MIKIIEGYYFTCDKIQYTLFKTGQRERVDFKTKKKTGDMTEYSTPIGYFSDISTMLTYVLKYEASVRADVNDVSDIETYLKIMSDIKREITDRLDAIESITTKS